VNGEPERTWKEADRHNLKYYRPFVLGAEENRESIGKETVQILKK
jgi:hypothetical protein